MNYYFIRRRFGNGLWVLGLLEMALLFGYFSLLKAVHAGENGGILYVFCKMGIWLNTLAFIGLLLGYLFFYRILGISRETWINGRVMTALDEAYAQNSRSAASGPYIAAWIPVMGLLIVASALAAAIGVIQSRNPSLSEMVEDGTVAELNECLAGNASGTDAKSKGGLTPLMIAADAGRVDMLDALLLKGAKVDAVDRSGRTALFHALGNPQMVEKLLLKGADVNVIDKTGMTAIHWAIRKQSEEDIRQLLQYGARVNVRNHEADTPLLMAVRSGFGVVDLLLMNGANPNLADQIGESPLHLAAMQDNLSAAQSLITAGADVTALSMQGWTPLHLASMNGSLTVVACLLRSGVDVDLENRRSQTALTCAILKNHPKVVDYLLEHGADLNRTDRSGNTYLHIALIEERDEIATQLIEEGADMEIANHAGVTPGKLMEMLGKESLLKSHNMVSSH